MKKKVRRALKSLTSWCDRLQQEAHQDRVVIQELRVAIQNIDKTISVGQAYQRARIVELERAMAHLINEVTERQEPKIAELERQVAALQADGASTNHVLNQLSPDYVEP